MKDYERMATARRQASAEEGRAAAAQKKAEAETAKAEQARIRNEQQEKVNQLKEWELHMQVRRTMQSPEQEALEEPMKPPILFGTPNDGGMDTWMAAGMPYSPGLGSAMAGGLPGR